jgi:hypothetical protein
MFGIGLQAKQPSLRRRELIDLTKPISREAQAGAVCARLIADLGKPADEGHPVWLTVRARWAAARGGEPTVLTRRAYQAAWMGLWAGEQIGLDPQSTVGLARDAICVALSQDTQGPMFDFIQRELRRAGKPSDVRTVQNAARLAKTAAEAQAPTISSASS